MSLEKRKLGSQGLEVSAIGLGCMGMSQSYGPYVNEELLGRALRGRRDEVILATKLGFRIENDKMMGTDRDSRPEHIR